jgi:hypothetical protein
MTNRLPLLLASIALTSLLGCEQAREAKNSYNAIVTTTKAAKGMAANMEAAQSRQEERVKRGDTLAINYKDLEKHLPAAIAGYAADGAPEGQSMQMTGMHYSTAQQKYKKGDETLNIQLMDYNGATAMFSASTAIMSAGMEMENDDQIMRSTNLGLAGVKAYETIGKKDHKASLILGVADRFFVSIEATGQNDSELVKTAAKSLDLEALAKM